MSVLQECGEKLRCACDDVRCEARRNGIGEAHFPASGCPGREQESLCRQPECRLSL